MGVKMNFRIITKNHAADSKIGSPHKIDYRADDTHESHPTAWELKSYIFQSEQTAPNQRNRKNAGKFPWLTTWLTAVTIFYYPINAVLKEHVKNMVIFALLYLILEL